MACLSLKREMVVSVVVAALAMASAPAAQAGDFLSSLFGGFMQPAPAPQPVRALPYASEAGASAPADSSAPNVAPRVSMGGTAYCVRTCDGRYFPVPATGGQSRAAACKSFCPASETKVFTGSSIDSAFSESGKSYSSLPNAFRYRNELVSGCTCNGKDSGGLAHIRAENDPTLRKGDLVAGASGVLVASRGGERRDVTSAHAAARLTLNRLPVVAAQ